LFLFANKNIKLVMMPHIYTLDLNYGYNNNTKGSKKHI
jgi:hypothetical protein